jgi:hypothetical protein
VVVKYEIENFKDQPVKLDIAENLRHVRSEVRGDSGRDVQWQLGPDHSLGDKPDAKRSSADQLVFRVELPAADEDGKAETIIHKLHLILKNEW